jgi:1-deoxyxylulose-5-phosphate synthase
MIIDPKVNEGPYGTIFLKHTGVRCSRLCLGTMTFGEQLDQNASHRLLDLAFDRGIFTFDTANAYSGGESERILGNWLKHHRNDVVVSTKVRYQMGDDLMSVGLSRRTIKSEVERSLSRLQTDFIDILYLHQPDDATDIGETLRAVEDLIREGKVHVLGVSNFAAWQIMEAYRVADQLGVTPPTIIQPMYNLLARGIEQELLPCCVSLDLSVYVYNPLAAGILTGKHDMKRGVTSGGRFDVFPYYQDRYWNDGNFQALMELKEIAASNGQSLIGLALNWLLYRPGVSGMILGASSEDQLRENLDVLGDPLPDDVNNRCNEVWQKLKGPSPAYNR